MTHTPEPWNVWQLAPSYEYGQNALKHIITTSESDDFRTEITGVVYEEANAHRIIACVNFCADVGEDEFTDNYSLRSLIDNLYGIEHERDVYLEWFRRHGFVPSEIIHEIKGRNRDET